MPSVIGGGFSVILVWIFSPYRIDFFPKLRLHALHLAAQDSYLLFDGTLSDLLGYDVSFRLCRGFGFRMCRFGALRYFWPLHDA
jgi:hypothetical protein